MLVQHANLGNGGLLVAPKIKEHLKSTYEWKSESKVPYCTSLLYFSPPNETVHSAAYQATLKKLKRSDQRKRPQMSDKRVLLLHDNA